MNLKSGYKTAGSGHFPIHRVGFGKGQSILLKEAGALGIGCMSVYYPACVSSGMLLGSYRVDEQAGTA